MYEKGLGVSKDYKEAVEWYQKAAEQGHARARSHQSNLESVLKFEECRSRAQQGNVKAQNNLGWMYENGRGVAQDYKEAVKWYRKAAMQGYADAQYNLGVRYANGEGVEQDDKEAVMWYRSVIIEHVKAQYNLGWMYENGRGVVKSIPKAREWYKVAADQGNEDAEKALTKLNSWRYMLLGF